jgi:hypothetical protein
MQFPPTPSSNCTCGRHFDRSGDADLVPPLDASFVQVLSSTTTEDTKDDSCLNLSQAVTSPTNPPPLCWSCIQRYVCGGTIQACPIWSPDLFRFRRNFLTRTPLLFFGLLLSSLLSLLLTFFVAGSVERAIDNDTTRLENECFAYLDAVRQDQQRIRGLRQATAALFSNDKDNNSTTITAGAAEQAFRDEILSLQEACRLSEMELDRLDELMREQLLLKQELDREITEDAEERNLLVWDAKNFDEDQVQLTREVMQMQSMEQRLLSFKLTGTAISLKVDKDRGLRYPLINGLRLAYRPKGDLDWKEVQSAWALAGQLLYMIGNVFEVTGQQWKLVPLSDCAKLFYYPKAKLDGTQPPLVVFNLGHPATKGSKALLTWNAAMSQTIVRARSVLADTPGLTILGGRALPYEMTPTTIGTLVLPKLDANDDSDWARTIHYMASNLLWLSENADAYLQDKVGTTALALLHGSQHIVE